MLLISTAFLEEAKPLIRHLELKAYPTSGPFSIYGNAQYRLVVTGMGQGNALFATAWCAGRFPKVSAFLNFGIAGADPNHAQVGDLFLVNYLTDSERSREVIFDLLWKHPFLESRLVSVDRPASEPIAPASLVDMEAMAFARVATRFTTHDRIACLKIVSDLLDPSQFKKADVKTLIQPHLDKICNWIRAWPGFQEKEVALPEEEVKAWLDALPLSQTQQLQLDNWILGALKRGESWSDLKSKINPGELKHKRDVNRWIQKIEHEFKF